MFVSKASMIRPSPQPLPCSDGLEQYPGFQQPLRRAFSFADKRLQILAFRFGSFDNVFLYRDFPDSHGEIQIQLLRPLAWCGQHSLNLTRWLQGIPLKQFAALDMRK